MARVLASSTEGALTASPGIRRGRSLNRGSRPLYRGPRSPSRGHHCHYAAWEGITVTVLLTHQPDTQPSLKIYGVKGSRISFHYIILFVYRSSGRSAPFLLAPVEGWGALLGVLGPLFLSRRCQNKHAQFSFKIGHSNIFWGSLVIFRIHALKLF